MNIIIDGIVSYIVESLKNRITPAATRRAKKENETARRVIAFRKPVPDAGLISEQKNTKRK